MVAASVCAVWLAIDVVVASTLTVSVAPVIAVGANVTIDCVVGMMSDVAVAAIVAIANDNRQLMLWLSLLVPSGQIVLPQIVVVGIAPEKSAPVKLVLMKFVAVNVAPLKFTAVRFDPEKLLVVRAACSCKGCIHQ